MQRVGECELGHGMFERDVYPAGKKIFSVEDTSKNFDENMNIENELLLEKLAG